MATRQGDLCEKAVYVRAVRAGAREVDFTFSTGTIDRYGEIVEQSWRLENYLKNPVVLWSHDSRSLPIGYAKNLGVLDGQLRGTVVFVDAKANPMAEQVFQSVRQGSINAGSVGFIPNELRLEMRDGREVVVLADNELVEFSVTPVPANPEALARREKAMGRRKSAETDPCGILTPPAEQPQPEPAPEPTPDEEEKPEPEAPAAVDAPPEPAAPEAEPPAAQEPAPETVPEPAAPSELDATKAELEATKALLVAANAKLVEERAAHAIELCRRDLEALVPAKIAPAEVDGMLALYSANPAAYATQLRALRARPDMALAQRGSTIGTAPIPERSPTNDGGQALLGRVNARLGR